MCFQVAGEPLLNESNSVPPVRFRHISMLAELIPDVAVAVPQQVLFARTKTISTHVPFAWAAHDCDVNLSVHHNNVEQVPIFHSGRKLTLNFAPLFCAYIRRSALDESAGLDAQYGRHYRSDRIMYNFIRHALGRKIVYVAAAVAYHRLRR